MRGLIDSLELREQGAQKLVNEAEQKGMEISEAKFKLRDVRQARLQSRTMVHAFSEGKFKEVVDNGIKISALIAEESQSAIHEYYFRRFGLVIATCIITLLALSLFLYVRRLERRQKQL